MHADYYSEHCLPSPDDYDPEGCCAAEPGFGSPSPWGKIIIAFVAMLALVAVCWPSVPFNGH